MSDRTQIDELARALHDLDPWLYGQDLDGEDIYKPWAEAPDSVQGHYRRSAEAAYRIIAPERDRYSEALREIATWAEYGYQDLSSPGVLSCVKKRAQKALHNPS